MIKPASAFRHWARRLLRVLLLPACALSLLAAMWVAVLYQVEVERHAARNEARAAAQALARVLDEHVGHILRQTDHATQLFKLAYEAGGGLFTLAAFTRRNGLMDSVLPARLALPLALIDRNGRVTETVRAIMPLSVAGEAYFQTLATGPADLPLFSTPLIEPATNKWQIQVARRLNDRNGNFAGVVLIMIDPIYFVDDYDRLSVDEHGLLVLMSRDSGLSVARSGERLFVSDRVDFTPARALPGTAGEVVVTKPFDHTARIYGYSDMPRYALAAVVGIGEQAAMARFDRHRAIYLWTAAAATLLIALITGVLMTQSARLRASIRAAHDAQAWLRAAADGSLDGVLFLRAWRGKDGAIEDFVVVDINDKAALMLGKPRAELLGQKAFALLPRFSKAGFLDRFVQVMAAGRPLEEEVEVRPGAEDARWVHHQIVPIDDGVAITSRDITARKQAEIEIRANRSFLQSLIDHLPQLIYVKSLRPDSFGRMVVWNNAAAAITGYGAAQVVGKTDCAAFPPDFALCNADEDRAMLATPMVIDLPEKPFLRPDGSLHYLHMVSLPLFDEHDQPEYVLCIAEDVTRRHEAELALRESESRLRTIADTLPAMVAYIDANQVYRFHNIAYEREFRREGAQVPGMTIRATVGEKRYAVLQPYILRALQGETLMFEEHDESDGVERTLEVTYIPQLGEDGAAVVGFHVMRQDISSQKREKRRLLKLSQVDALTGLTNRAGFQQKLAAAMNESAEDGHLMAVMYMDIDRFKPVNDTYGHNVGDQLLKAFSARLAHTLRASDTIARLGGDEFTIIMEKITRREDASITAAKIVSAMQAPFELDGVTVSVSASIGLTFYQDGALDPDALLKQADKLLYQAKQAGRNTYRAAA